MGVGLAFLRPKDGDWEGDYQLRGWGGFGELQEAYLARGGPSFLYFREDEYDVEFEEGKPPHAAWVSEELARDLLWWIEREGPKALAVWRGIPEEEIGSCAHFLKRLVEEYLAEGYAVLVSL